MTTHHQSAQRRLPSVWKLITSTLGLYRRDWWAYFKILAIVAIPANLFSGSAGDYSNPGDFAVSAAVFIMNTALVWAIARRFEEGSVPSVARAYYDGSSLIVRYVLVGITYVAMLVPAAIGLVFIGTVFAAAGSSSVTWPEGLLLGAASSILAIPSLYLAVRYSLASTISAREGLTPVAALRASKQLTIGYFWPVAGRLVLLVGLLVAISIPVIAIGAALVIMKQIYVAMFFFQTVATFIALPILNLYLFNLYAGLDALYVPAVATREGGE